MGLRPAKCYREFQGQIWARFSKKKPRKSFVKGQPRPKVRQYNMGVDKRFEIEVDLVAVYPIQLRDNAIEASRQACNKYLEKHLPGGYFMQILKYPHYVIRESNALGVAGADRISKGMKKAFGKPKGRILRVNVGEAIYRVRTTQANLPVVKKALDRAQRKMSGQFSPVVRDIRTDAKNLLRSVEGVVFESKDAKAKEEADAAAAAAATPAAGAEGAAATPAAGADAKGTPAAAGKDAKAAPAKDAKAAAPAKK
ncbi:50S ribosomal protein L10e [uncultured archaeon]|nr:50S ribosomal protein L10e [uncultured archaeon]